MSEHRVTIGPGESPIEGPAGLLALVSARIRPPVVARYEGDGSGQGDVVYVFAPDLTTEEATRFAQLVAFLRGAVLISVAERERLEPIVAELRTFRTRTPAEWSAMTAAQRDNALISWCQDITDVLRAMLRD